MTRKQVRNRALFEREMADIWIKQMSAIDNADELYGWATARAKHMGSSYHADELRETYLKKMEQLRPRMMRGRDV